jgi:hypothetical protein
MAKTAVKGTYSFAATGYSILPAPGARRNHVFTLHAIPKGLRPIKDFDPGELRKEVLAQVGILVFSYARV